MESANGAGSGAAMSDDDTGSTGSGVGGKSKTQVHHAQRQTDSATPDQCWRGCSMEEIHRGLNEFELEHVAAVQPSSTHTVLHHFPIRQPDNEPPRPLRAHPKWDALHVRLPCSPKSQYPVTEEDGSARIESRWEMIEGALLRPITNSQELQAAILTYNSKYEQQWNFRALHKLFEEELDESEARVFFEDLLPRIIRLALRLPELVQAPIPLLKQGQNHSITLTQQQVSCLLANAFLCTFPRRNTLKRKSEYSNFPDINFNTLYQSQGHSVIEKLKCICHYFRRVCPTERDSSNVPTGVVTFTRRSLTTDELPDWAECAAPLGATPLHITAEGTIEDQGSGLLQVDFANKFLGGGVLGFGCVQEEIRFVICPELLISKLFTECLRPTEALVMIGCERYSNYSGYARTFQWDSNHEDSTPYDSSRRRQTHIVAIDALHFQQKTHQYREELILRELNKAYVGFLHPLLTPAPGVASGNWGCGAFGGDATLKALLQLMVCTSVGRPLVYFTFGNATLRDDVHCIHNFFIEHHICVKDLWGVLRRFHAQKLPARQLYEYIYSELSTSNKLKCSTSRQVSQANANGFCIAANMNDNNRTTASGSSATSGDVSGNGGTSNSVKKSSTAAHHISPDIFLDTSSESSDTNDVQIEHVALVAGKDDNNDDDDDDTVLEPLPNLDDMATNAALIAATRAVESAEPTHSPTQTHTTSPPGGVGAAVSSGTPLGTPSKSLRQRTLLEMLDQCYTEGVSSKRRCQSKPDGGN